MTRSATDVDWDFRSVYRPHPRQAAFHQCLAEEVLYGGAAGGGKSMALIAAGVMLCLAVPGAKVILFRRTFPELEQEIIPRMRALIPEAVATYNTAGHVFTFVGGATFRLGYLQRDSDVTRYQGPEYQLIMFDELTHFSRRAYTYMRSRLRMAGPVAEAMRLAHWIPRMMSTTNPGGLGHFWVKAMFVDPSPGPDRQFLGGVEDGQGGSRVLAYIPARATDNPYLDVPAYNRALDALDPVLARALRDGDWDILEGVRFPQWRRSVHVIEPEALPIPLTGVPLGVGVDYGLAAPFCALWGAVLPDDLVVVYRELYGPNLTPEQQARLIRSSERPDERLPGRPLPVALDPSCWERPATTIARPVDPDAPAEGSIAWWYRRELGGAVRKATNDRVGGWALLDRHLRLRGDGLPRLLVYSTCRNLIRTLPTLQRDAKRPEDIVAAPKQDDHAADAVRYLLQLLVGGGHDRTARDVSPAPERAGPDPRDLALDTNLVDAGGPPGPGERARRAAARRPYTPARNGGATDW